MRILFVGQAQWCNDLVRGINAHTTATASMVAIDHAWDAFTLLKTRDLRTADLVVRVGFRPAARTIRGRAFDAALAVFGRPLAGRLAYLWLGTDVLDTLSDAASGRDMRRFRRMTDGARHVAASFALQDELASVGVQASVAWIPARNPLRGGPLPPFPSDFTVLSYVPDARHEFYGGPQLLEAAALLPDVRFMITTSSGGAWSARAPRNVTFLGRVPGPEMPDIYASSSCLVRMVRHDGFSGSVVEALSYGRPVVYSIPFPNTTLVTFGNVSGLVTALEGMRAERGTAPWETDEARASWARSVSDEPVCYRQLLDALTGGPGVDRAEFEREAGR